MRCLKVILLFLLAGAALNTKAQEKPAFWNDIQAFKAQDSVQPPPQNAILFIGSSSFTKWTDVASYFPGYTILNRGFGGSTLPDVTRYVDDIVTPYHPKEIVIYCGENDIAAGLDSKVVADRFKDLFTAIRTRFPSVPIGFISMKPSPSRVQFRHLLTQGNQIIKNFLYTQQNTFYVNVFDLMLDASGNYRPDLFQSDMLHMTAAGYAIWAKAITPYLMK
ncbi:GDSL-type esterase/lipase family protein [Dinghuibacter silviterrae]|uniref:Lysophospholipase L1-like esterase n=1 Tax=Dinghuibacter silviterrae TaxID=1539049 RepID=A0A4R8DS36_9BACT|nr:GDSL-type esterase/lipase family protein [Dinghuibacter silviterrae]TDW99950.1 lysophospholipase L1-like esterase [Dinghuibacter silviterrae]